MSRLTAACSSPFWPQDTTPPLRRSAQVWFALQAIESASVRPTTATA